MRELGLFNKNLYFPDGINISMNILLVVPGDTGDSFTLYEPELHIQVKMLGFEWVRLQSDRPTFQLPIPPFDIGQVWLHFKKQHRLCNLC